MHKIVCFLRKSLLIPIGIGVLICILYFADFRIATIWLAHIWMVIYFMPIAYELTGSFNLAFLCNPAFECKKAKRGVTLSPVLKKFFCGYDNGGNIVWLILIYQCIFLAYICIFLSLNIILLAKLIINDVDKALWMNIWMIEMIVQCSIFAVVRISSYLKDIYLWSRERKNKKHRNVSVVHTVNDDIRIIRNKKIIRQKNELVAKLKQYGMRRDKHNHYIIQSGEVTKLEEALHKEFPNLYADFSKNEKGKPILKIFDEKEDQLLMQILIK